MNNKLKTFIETSEKLNEKQLAFVRAMLVDGLSPVDAYMKVYEVHRKAVASASAYRLLKKEVIKAELSSLSNQLKALERVPKSFLVTKAKELLDRCAQDLDNGSNRKYYMECLDYLAKVSGNYSTNQTITKVNLKGSVATFGEWDPEQAIPLENNPSDISDAEHQIVVAEPHNTDDSIEWDPESDPIDESESI